MTPSKQKYKKEYSAELFRIAQGDLESARALHKAKQGRIENVIYLAQQSIEKTLKAVIIFYGLSVTHTHDIEVLLTLLGEERYQISARYNK